MKILARPRRGVLLVSASIAILGGLAAFVFATPRDLDQACPPGRSIERPLSVHLEPNIVEHESGLLVHSGDVTPGTLLLACADGVVLGMDLIDQSDIQAGTDMLLIPTRWVDWMWLTGRLDGYQDPDRWRVVYP